ncbi:MAG TPA: DinB family protein [Thermoanaerobaculia bacterium]|nr:DinB family protein [Thermoanaerobaculia bacterium]
MDQISSLIEDNLHFLAQARDLLTTLSDQEFEARPGIAMSPVGSHLRHCLDFYSSFLDGVDVGVIDYDARHRDPRLETERAHALAAVRTLMNRLNQLVGQLGNKTLSVAMDRMGWEDEEGAWADTTVARELQFLRSHTVHHYALMAAVLRLLGLDPGPDFGVAPATLNYRRSLVEKAPAGD